MQNEVTELIESFNAYILKIAPGCVAIAELLRSDEIQTALQTILQFSEGMSWLIQSVELLKENDVFVSLDIKKIHDYLMEVNNGLEIHDYVLVADMFEYEIAPFFEQIKIIEGNQH